MSVCVFVFMQRTSSRLHGFGNTHSTMDIPGVNGGVETILRVHSFGNGLALRAKDININDRAEDFLLHRARVFGLSRDDGGFDEESVSTFYLQCAASRFDFARALLLDELEVFLDSVELDFVGLGAVRGCWVHGVAGLDDDERFCEELLEPIGASVLDVDAGIRNACLAGHEFDTEGGFDSRFLEVCIVEDDCWRFTA